MKKLLIVATVLACAATAVAQAPSEGDTARTGPDNDPSRVVCVTMRETGSLTRRTRTCRTRAQWDLVKQENRQAVDKVQQYKPSAE